MWAQAALRKGTLAVPLPSEQGSSRGGGGSFWDSRTRVCLVGRRWRGGNHYSGCDMCLLGSVKGQTWMPNPLGTVF